MTPQFPRPGDPVYAVVLTVVEAEMAPLRERLDELEERSLYMIRLIAAGAASAPPLSRPETSPPAATPRPVPTVAPRGGRLRTAIRVVACVLALGLGSLFGLTHFYR
jgi:hypothetical protein